MNDNKDAAGGDAQNASGSPSELETLGARYESAMHSVQSGIATLIALHGPELKSIQPKHLRVGIDSAMVNDAGLTRLLIAKGVFTELEYVRAITEEAEREKLRYEEMLSEMTGKKVSLV